MARDRWGQLDDGRGPRPAPVSVVCLALVVLAAFSVLVLLGGLLMFEVTAELVGALVWAALPGIVGLVLAALIWRSAAGGSALQFWGVIGVAALALLGALGSLGNGELRGLTQLVLPVVLLVSVTRPESRAWFGTSRSARR